MLNRQIINIVYIEFQCGILAWYMSPAPTIETMEICRRLPLLAKSDNALIGMQFKWSEI